MTSELFNRLKKLAKREGKIVFADDKDIFVILPFNEYESLSGDFYDEECDGECDDENCACGHEHNFDDDFNFGEEIFANTEDDKKPEDGEADKDLIKRVNEDIAKWREEQASHESMKTVKHENKEEIVIASPSEGAAIPPEQKKEDVLTEEERYYLEPLE